MKLREKIKTALQAWRDWMGQSKLDKVIAENEQARKVTGTKIVQLTTRVLEAEKQRDYFSVEHERMSLILQEALQELDSVNAEYAHFKAVFKNLTKSCPLLVVLPPHAALMAGDFYVEGGRLHPLDPYLVGQMAGPFALFIRKLQ